MFKKINKCRICGNDQLILLVDLGEQYLTGVFPKTKQEIITSGPLELVKCVGDQEVCCGLVQLRHSFDLEEMYGSNYGYRSGLNRSMVEHLHHKVKGILARVNLLPGDIVLDIGSNDSTLLKSYTKGGCRLIGMDPTGEKFRQYYPEHVELISEFFSAGSFRELVSDKKAKIITSISMFYDLESPLDFMYEIKEILADDGVWVFEQSYMPTMLKMHAYDTICHEHLEYYALRQIKWMTDRAGLKIIDVQFNTVNGGSFHVMVAQQGSTYSEATELLNSILDEEEKNGLNTLTPYAIFRDSVFQHRNAVIEFLDGVRKRGEKILGYGASTKGNVILQFCGLTDADIPAIAEVNNDKFGCFTPGTHIPIISEAQAHEINSNYFLILPWHFRDNIIERERDFLRRGGKLVFPLPEIEVVGI